MTDGRVKTGLALALLLTVLPGSMKAAGLSGIKGHYAESYIMDLHQKDGEMSLVYQEANACQPDEPVTRAAYIAMLMDAFSYAVPVYYTRPDWTDIDEISPDYRSYMAGAAEQGLIDGRLRNGKTHSGWNEPLERQEAAVILARALSRKGPGQDIGFTDQQDIAPWAAASVALLAANGIISGYPGGSFRPHGFLTLGEAAVMISKGAPDYVRLPQSPVTVYAGGTGFGNRDGILAEAALMRPQGILADQARGRLYIADALANQLRMVQGGQMTTLAGTAATTGWNGNPRGGYWDHGQAEEAGLYEPGAMALAANGDLYFTDSGNHAVRVIRSSDGGCATIAGNGSAGYRAGRQEETQFDTPSGIAIWDGGLYVADTLNHCIRRIDSDGGTSVFAGTPGKSGFSDEKASLAAFHEPMGITFDAGGALYVADTGNSAIRMVRDGQVTTLAGMATDIDAETGVMTGGYRDGAAENAQFKYPQAICVAGETVFVADTGNNRIRMIQNGRVYTIAGNGQAQAADGTGRPMEASFHKPWGLAYSKGVLYISDSLNSSIKAIQVTP